MKRFKINRMLFFMSLGGVFWIPEIAFAHAGRRGFVMLLPTDFFITGGGVVVAMTFLIAVLIARKSQVASENNSLLKVTLHSEGILSLSFLSLSLLVFLVVCGFLGTRDPLENPLPLVLWIGWWVGWTLITAVLGDIWHWVHPWHALDSLVRRLPGVHPGEAQASFPYPEWLGYWPSVIFFLIFAWFELIHPSPMDPDLVATVVLLYIMLVASGMLLFGKQNWLQYAEPFCVFFRMVGWLSPLEWKKKPHQTLKIHALKWPCWKLMKLPPIPLSGIAFILLALSTVSFDGLSKTFWWMGLLGENPLEYPGRTVLMLPNTGGMLGTFVIFLVLYALTRNKKGKSAGSDTLDQSLIFSIIPIAFGYHFAHYLPNFLVDIQYAFISLTDPLAMGWDLFGVKNWEVRSSFLTHHQSVVVIWYLQISGIVLAHIAAVIVAHLKTLETASGGDRVILSQIPSTLLMIAYTVLGLWLLSTPIAA